MPDSKITALTALTAADPANDMFPVVDVSDTTMAASGTTKRISINNILACSPSATLASATITGDLTVATSALKVTGGKVGIGLVSPNRNLSIFGASNSLIHFTTTATGPLNTDGFTLGVETDSSVTLFNAENTPFNFYVNSTLGMTLNATGLGMGVASPSFKLHVQENASNVIARFTGSNTNGSVIDIINTGAGGGSYKIGSNYTIGGAGEFAIYDSTAAATRLLISSSGNVGIGVTPLERLTVAGTGSFGGTGSAGIKFHSASPLSNNLCWLLANDQANSNVFNLYYYSAGVFSGRAFVVNQSGNFMVRTPATPPTIPDTEMMVFNLTSNTNLRISVKGTDGTTRTANITLA